MGATGPRPEPFEHDPRGQDTEKDALLGAVDDTSTHSGLGKREDSEDQPAGPGDEAMGVATPPEVEGAPRTPHERRQCIEHQLPPWWQRRRENQKPGDSGEVQPDPDRATGQEPVDTPLPGRVRGEALG